MRPRPMLRRTVACALAAAGLLAVVLGCQSLRVVHQVRSHYQLITVADTTQGHRRLIFDGRLDGSDPIQSEMDLDKPRELVLSYTQAMMAALPLAEDPRRILLLGLGGGSMQKYLHDLLPEALLETVEIDPEVVRIAREFFGVEPGDRQIVHVGDGRAFIETPGDRYDVIFLDAYGPDSLPMSLATREFLEAVRSRVAEGGVVCANLLPGNPRFGDMLKTWVEVFPEALALKPPSSGNFIVCAPLDRVGLTTEDWTGAAAAFEAEHATGFDLPKFIRRHAEDGLRIPGRAKVLRDEGTPSRRRPRAARAMRRPFTNSPG